MTQFVLTQEMIDQFLHVLQVQKKSQRVIVQYQSNLKKLKEVSQNHGDMVNKEILDLWKQQLIKEGYAKGTITNKVVSINHFLRFCGYNSLCFQKGGKKDLTGRQFGNLIVLKEGAKRASDRNIYWRCRCNICGKEKEIPTNQLLKGVQTSCGCEKSIRLQKTNGYIDGTCLKTVLSDKLSSNNTSGHKGVFQKRGKWAAKIQYKKKNYYLGSYDRIEDAIEVRKEAEQLVKDDAKKLLEELNKKRERQHEGRKTKEE